MVCNFGNGRMSGWKKQKKKMPGMKRVNLLAYLLHKIKPLAVGPLTIKKPLARMQW